MPTLTPEEMREIMCLESFYCNLQNAGEKIIANLRYLSHMEPSKVSFFQRIFHRKQEDPVEREREQLHKLLEIITSLKYTIEENMPILVDGELYFRFRSFDNDDSFPMMKTGKSQNPSADLDIYFGDLNSRLATLKALPEVSETLLSPFSRSYCPSFARENLGLPSPQQNRLSD